MIDVYVLDKNLNKIAIIDYCESVIWASRYCNVGDFELYLPMSKALADLIKDAVYVVRSDDSKHPMIIEKLTITTDEERGDYATISGRSLQSILARRIIWYQTTIDDRLIMAVNNLINANIINPSISNRKIDNFEISESAYADVMIKKQYNGESLLDAIIELLGTYKVGFDVTYDGVFKFKTYNGIDKSKLVRFSSKFDNLISSEYGINKEPYRNLALVLGEGEGIERKRLTVASNDDITGLGRCEIMVDAKDVSSKTDAGIISDEQYTELLRGQGKDALSTMIVAEEFTGEIDASVNYEYNVDYNLGDIVELTNDYGLTSKVRITEIVESWDDNGYKCIPTYEREV